MSDIEIRKILNFNEADLTANRAGKLTARQNERLDKSDKMDKWIELILAGVYLIFPIIFSFTMIIQPLSKGIALSDISMVNWAIVGFLWLLMGWLAVRAVIKSFSKVNRTIQNVEGEVSFAKIKRRIETTDSNGNKSFLRDEVQYDLHVGTNIFEGIDEQLMKYMRDGDIYKVYYINGFGVLSTELVKKGK